MTELERGESARLSGEHRSSAVVEVGWNPGAAKALVYVLVTDSAGFLLAQDQIMFRGRPDSPDRAVFVRSHGVGGVETRSQVQVDLGALPNRAGRLICVFAVEQPRMTLETVRDIAVKVFDPATGHIDATFTIAEGGVHKCLYLGSLRRGEQGWEIEAQGDGFESDIRALAHQHL